jgi:S-adenosyl methyltransferase
MGVRINGARVGVAPVYDWLLGGTSNYQVDRDLGESMVPPYEGAGPEVTWVGPWHCYDPALADSDGSRWLYCAVARKSA